MSIVLPLQIRVTKTPSSRTPRHRGNEHFSFRFFKSIGSYFWISFINCRGGEGSSHSFVPPFPRFLISTYRISSNNRPRSDKRPPPKKRPPPRPYSAWARGGEWYHLEGQRVTYIFGKLFTLSKKMYVIAFAKVSSFMIFQGGRVSEVFGPILHFQLIVNFYWLTHPACGDFSFAK